MKPVRIFTHLACEPPGYLAQLLGNLGYPYQQVCLYDGEQVPMELDNIAGLVIMAPASFSRIVAEILLSMILPLLQLEK